MSVENSYRVKDSLNNLYCSEAAAIFYSWVKNSSRGSYLVLAPNDGYAKNIYHHLEALFGSDSECSEVENTPEINFFPSWEGLPFESNSPDLLTVCERMRVLSILAQSCQLGKGVILVVSVPNIFQKVVSPERLNTQKLNLSINDSISVESIIESLEWLGYSRKNQVEDVGDYSQRGSVLDIFSPLYPEPVRVQYFSSQIDSFRFFSCETQRSYASLDVFSIIPVREFAFSLSDTSNEIETTVIPNLRNLAEKLSVPSSLIRSYEEKLRQGLIWNGAEYLSPFLFNDGVELTRYLKDFNTYFVGDLSFDSYVTSWWDTVNTQYEIKLTEHKIIPDKESLYLNTEEVKDKILTNVENVRITWSEKSEFNSKSDVEVIDAAPLLQKVSKDGSQNDPFHEISNNLRKYIKDGYFIVLSLPTDEKRNRIRELLEGYGLRIDLTETPVSSLLINKGVRGIKIITSDIFVGFIYPKARFLLVSERELFSRLNKPNVRRSSFKRSPYRRVISSLSQLTQDDYIVHEQYGIGKFSGLKSMSLGGTFGEFIDIEYANKAKLFVPIQDFSKVGKYSSSTTTAPALTKLGSGMWEKQRAKVKKSIAELTGLLLKTIAFRSLSKGFNFGPVNEDDEWFAGLFPFEETTDQKRTIKEVLSDMSSSKPMDRLVCGDVGYGKTEVALRAAFKAASSGKQTAVLVPTTILAEQHYRTFLERFDGTAVNVKVLSRFSQRTQVSKIIEDVQKGLVDVLIGTHRILQSDIYFKDLGLVVIDEEHRFGVAHKERLKSLRAEVDVLSLSATPIPRTLQMALFGTRDLSVIETPPFDRQAVHTEVIRYDNEIIDGAIKRELMRGGQVFIVHHFIEGLEEIASDIKSRVPQASIAIVHGRLPRNELEKRMLEFYNGEVNILVATSIIESGLDIPNANTMIILKAEQFGLAQLYQLRGRVGRSSVKGYAYICYSDTATLTDDAKRRLKAIGDMDSLGIGYRLAVQDMEIRGAGSLLGKDQSGHVTMLGYDMYMKVLEDAVKAEKDKRGIQRDESYSRSVFLGFEPDISLGCDAYIPEEFVPDMNERLILYQEVAGIITDIEEDSLLETVSDRFGYVPSELKELILTMRIRNYCKLIGVRKLKMGNDSIKFSLISFPEEEDPRMNSVKEFDFEITQNKFEFTIQIKDEWENQVRKLLDLFSDFYSKIYGEPSVVFRKAQN